VIEIGEVLEGRLEEVPRRGGRTAEARKEEGTPGTRQKHTARRGKTVRNVSRRLERRGKGVRKNKGRALFALVEGKGGGKPKRERGRLGVSNCQFISWPSPGRRARKKIRIVKKNPVERGAKRE